MIGLNLIKNISIVLAIAALTGCGGSDLSSADQTSPPSVVSTPLQASSNKTAVNVDITAAAIASDIVTISFQIVDEEGLAINHLSANDFSVTLAKLNPSEIANNTGNWQSYINKIETPTVGEATLPKMQATLESGSSGEFINNGDGTYQYSYLQTVNITDEAILAQADIEGLDLSYNNQVVHRSGMQLELDGINRNAVFDWIPATGQSQVDGIFDHAITSTANCNSCHGELAAHGGSRLEVKYCVTCHNPGSTDANSGNTVNFKNMIHKIHRGKNLPSVQAGGEYKIYGFRDRVSDYSDLTYPNDILTCQICHAGNATTMPMQTPTVSGDNWREISTRAVCGSCHDDVDFTQHYGGQNNDENCMSCHQNSAIAGSLADRHRNLATEALANFQAEILNITNTAAGEFPVVQFKIVNPETGVSYDILNDPEWSQDNGGSSLSVGLSWANSDYTNTGNQGDNANSVELDALALAVDNGDGSFSVTSTFAIPDGSLSPNYVASGSGTVYLSGRAAVSLDEENPTVKTRVGLKNQVQYFSIDEENNQADSRRKIVSTQQCLTCHGELIKHGGNKVNNVETCVTCHNARNTDKRTRDVAQTPPSDGKSQESLDFKTMIHGIHSASKREQPLQLVGFRGFNTYIYDENKVRYPNSLANCNACHIDDSYQLPLASSVLGTTIDIGLDIQDHDDDIVISPTSAVCQSCHDSSTAKVHMESNGGHFSTSQALIDSGDVLEQCVVCHGAGKVFSVEAMHDR